MGSCNAGDLVRFSIAMPEDLLRAFDAQISRRSDTANRSEAIRDLIRINLTAAGFVCDEAEDGLQALAKAKASRQEPAGMTL